MNYSDLEKLNELKSKGVITEEEFNEQKKKLLNSSSKVAEETTKINQDIGRDNVVVNNTVNVNSRQSTRIGFLTVLGYIIGTLTIISGLSEILQKNIIAGVLLMLGGLVVVPAFNNFLDKKFHFRLSTALRIILFLILCNISSRSHINTSHDTLDKISYDDVNAPAVTEEKQYISLGETITSKDWELNIESVQFSQRVDPPKKDIYYNYYQVENSDNTYLYIILSCKNISTLSLGASDIASVSVKYKDAYTYTSFSAVPDSSRGFSYTSLTNIKPLTTQKVYYLAEVPKVVEDDADSPIEINIELKDKTVTYKYR